MKVCIVGGVAGGATAAARLRRLDEATDILLFEKGPYISYANCGLPYHVGGVISERESLLLQSPQAMRQKYRIDVRVNQEVTAIDREKRMLSVQPAGGDAYFETYDILILATGSSPLRPAIPGGDSPAVSTLWTVPDTDHIRSLAQPGSHAIVVGGGFIGLETAENLIQAGMTVSLVDMADQVMPPLDREMALLLEEELLKNGVDLHLGDRVTAFDPDGDGVIARLGSGVSIPARLVILAIGVRPNTDLARDAGLTLGERGGVVVDDRLRTSDPAIYAVGDMIEVNDLTTGRPAMIPLAGPANKQGRIAANNIMGADERYEGTQGTAIAQVFSLSAAATGQNEKALQAQGLGKGADYESLIITQNSHAGYYPGATPLTLKLLFSADGERLYGAQIIGREGVDKRIDTLSVAMRLGAGPKALKALEMAYAPPYSSAKDPVNMAGFVADNVLTGKTVFAPWDIVETHDPGDTCLLDVREDGERRVFALPGAVSIPLGQLRDRLDELDRDKEMVVFCAIGVRAHNAARILMGHGFKRVRVYPGGMRFYQSTHRDGRPAVKREAGPSAPGGSCGMDCSGRPLSK